MTFNPSGFIAPNTAWTSTQGLYGVLLEYRRARKQLHLHTQRPPECRSLDGLRITDPAGAEPGRVQPGEPEQWLLLLRFVLCRLHRFHEYELERCLLPERHRPAHDAVDRRFARTSCSSVSTYTGGNVVPNAIPTYYNPGQGYNSEAYLGNNGFYTRHPG